MSQTPSTATPPTTLRVWDPLIRLFHWSLVIGFTVAYFTEEEWLTAHTTAGYTVLGLVLFRLLWGVVGSKYARFRQFIGSPVAAFTYLRGLPTGTARHYMGHNPAGGWMVIALLLALLVTTVSGIALYGADKGAGPLASYFQPAPPAAPLTTATATTRALKQDDEAHEEAEERHETKPENASLSKAEEEWLEELHEVAANLTLLLVLLHLLGVVISSVAHRENLPRAMVTGRKTVRADSIV